MGLGRERGGALSMPWIRIALRYGPGRQSGHVEYRWLRRATSKALGILFDDLRDQHADLEYGPAIVRMDKVRRLPRAVALAIAGRQRARMADARALLRVLRRTPTSRRRPLTFRELT